jgi:hypothetical protein
MVQHGNLQVIGVVVCAEDAWVLDTEIVLSDVGNGRI